jgi:hypothetical protein
MTECLTSFGAQGARQIDAARCPGRGGTVRVRASQRQPKEYEHGTLQYPAF